ncbi:regulatory protein RecX [Kouleothrix sp.]|uniref:regulatory protein RecX n=1 Tax=Kouleothrix sp. TaxID=2779161 RepID=UPI003918E1A8
MPAGTITSLRAQLNDPERVNVFVNGEFALGVSLTTITRAGLHVGKVLGEAEYAQLEQIESGDKAFQAALRFLEARPRSVAEIRTRLGRKDFAPEAIDSALDRLAQLGLVDDAAFARFWVENRLACRPRGANALRDELRRKGIDSETAGAVLTDQALAGDEAERALVVARGALRKYADSADRQAFTRRMGGYLQRRGFTFDVIRPIIDQLWAEAHGTTSDEETS